MIRSAQFASPARHPLSALAVIGMLALPLGLGAQEADPEVYRGSADPDRRPVFMASTVAEGLISLDGRIDEAVWQVAPIATGFIQADPIEGNPVEHDTEVRILFSNEAMYVAARMWDDDPGSIAKQLVRRDSRGNFDWFSVQVDPNLDRRTGYAFQVSAAGVQRDVYIFNDEREDDAWDAVWDSEIAFDDQGWTAEFRIPLSQIRYEGGGVASSTWGLNLVRRREAGAETSYFSLKSDRVRGRISQYGQIQGVQVPSSVRRMEARPYMLSSFESSPAEAGDPFFDGTAQSIRVGGDLKVGLGSAFSIDATINPDFGQVDADPAVINLSAFETFQQERRPFFVEDSNLLTFRLSGFRNTLFYSRRIGRSPQGFSPSGADFVDEPVAATILGSAKFTGRTEGGLSVGGLLALTDRETGLAYFDGPDRTDEYVVEPRSQYGVIRLEQDLRGGDTQIGAIVTGVNRNGLEEADLSFLAERAWTGGVDFEHQWSNRTWALKGFLAGSRVEGDSTAMIRVQRASNHRFQRPDALTQSVDSTATSLTGANWRLEFSRVRGDHWTWAMWTGETTEGFEVNDIGFSSDREQVDFGGRLNYKQITPQWAFRNYNITMSTFHDLSHEVFEPELGFRDALTSSTLRFDLRGEFKNFWGFRGDVNYSPDTYSYAATRGGPVMVDRGSIRGMMNFNTDRRKPLNFGFNFGGTAGADGSQERISLGTDIEYRPTPTLELSVKPRWSRSTEVAQYVTSTSTLAYQPTFGRRYLFAELDQESVSLETRLNLSLTPRLTFQLYAQPLVASGDYLGYRQLERARSFDFIDFTPGTGAEVGGNVLCTGGTICRIGNTQHVDFDADGTADYSFSDRDFNVQSLIGNAVLRWEYRPGSTLFLVWQRQQAGRSAFGNFDLGRDLNELWGIEAENVFILKLDYWLPL